MLAEAGGSGDEREAGEERARDPGGGRGRGEARGRTDERDGVGGLPALGIVVVGALLGCPSQEQADNLQQQFCSPARQMRVQCCKLYARCQLSCPQRAKSIATPAITRCTWRSVRGSWACDLCSPEG